MRLYESYSDSRLATLLRHSDEKAYTEIYRRYWEKLFSIAYRFNGSKEAAEEVVQEIFLFLWDKREALLIDNLPAYLATASKFAVFRQTVRHKRRQELLNEHLSPVTIADDEEAIQARFLEEYINGVVETLPPQCRVVYQLRRAGDLSVQEIARQLDISPHTVRNHLNKALKVIRVSLRHAHLCLAAFA